MIGGGEPWGSVCHKLNLKLFLLPHLFGIREKQFHVSTVLFAISTERIQTILNNLNVDIQERLPFVIVKRSEGSTDRLQPH
jgi:hypothetical protein